MSNMDTKFVKLQKKMHKHIEMKSSGVFIMYGAFHIRDENLHEKQNQLFNYQIIECI